MQTAEAVTLPEALRFSRLPYDECFVEPGILFQLFRLPHLSFAFEGAGAILSKKDTVAEEITTVVFSEWARQVQ